MSDVLDIANTFLSRVKKSGPDNIMAKCPFHVKSDGTEEKTPSFAMNILNGLWYCHSCHERGNLYTFLKNVGVARADIDFHYKNIIEEAESHAPQRAEPLNPTQASTHIIEEHFLGLFDLCPQLLLDEGYPEDLLRQYDIGYDERNERITFPLRDARGRLIGISGRSIHKHVKPRYKIYDKEYVVWGLPERRLEKRALLWNVHNVHRHFDFEKPIDRFVVVTEGFKATLRVAQAGIPSVIALIGSYLAEEQLWQLTRLGAPILMMLDNNDAGRRGTMDAARRLVSVTPSLHIVPYEGDQPSDLTPEAVTTAILSSEPYVTWLQRQPL